MTRVLILSALILLILTSAAVSFAEQHRSGHAATSHASAPAQEPGGKRTRLMVGLDAKQTFAPGEDAANRFGVGLTWRWRSRTPEQHDGFTLAYGLPTYNTRITGDVLGAGVQIGDVRLRQLMAGVDYKMPRGKWTWSVGAAAGLSMNKLRELRSFREHVTEATGDNVITDIHNSFAWSPRVKGWYDITRRVSLGVEASYHCSRPDLTIRSGGVDMSRRLNADAFLFKTGVVYGVW